MQKETLIGNPEGSHKSDKSLRHGLYLYCLYPGESSLPDLVGIDGDQKVFTLSYGDTNAAVSLVPLEEFGARALEQRSGDLEWVAPRVLIHERVIEEIMAVCPVMPMRFGTIFAGREKIDELLKIHHAKVARFFGDIADKEEWGVKGYINGGRLEEAVKRLNPAVQAGEAKLQETSSGQAYLLRKKRDLAIKHGLSGFAAQIGEEVFQDLLVHAVKGVRNKALKLEAGEERGGMILNAAFLVPKTNVGLFQAKVKDIEEKYRSQGLNLSVTGPWPPYNFCPVFDR
jgi:hypothetical protein